MTSHEHASIPASRRGSAGFRAGRVALCLALVSGSAGLAPAVHAQSGEALYATCTTCHGSDGAGNPALGAPAIAGQLESYVARQLHYFRDGMRGAGEGDQYGAQMVPFAAQLADDAAVAAVAAYVAAMTPVAASDLASGDARRGASLYNGNCGACHGGSAEGNEALQAPRLAGLDAAYLRRQFAHYADGVRGTHTDDRPVRQMAMMARTLGDDVALEDVISHIHSLEVQP
jgi:cytochrome c oxidase subunit 2